MTASTSKPSAKQAILQIVPKLDTGGAERSAVDIAAALVREGFRAPVVSEGGRLVPELEAAGGEWIAFSAASKSPVTIIANAFRLKRIVERENVVLVHARSRAPAWSALMAARMAGVPFVTTYHGIYNASNALKRRYNSVMARGDAVIANSDWTAAHVREAYGKSIERLAVIPRGVDLTHFDPAGIAPDRVSALRNKWGVKQGEIVVLLPGRLTRLKGQLVLIDALAIMRRDGTLGSVRAVLAGDAQGRDAFEAEVTRAIEAAGLTSHVIIAGHVRDMAAAYLASDIVVSASVYAESFGRVPVEAAVMGKPAIATDHGGARETVLAGVSGLLVPPGDAAALATALARLVAMGPEGRAAMGAKGRAHAFDRYTRERMCADTIALYRTLL